MIFNTIITTLEFISIYYISHALSHKSLKPTLYDFGFLILSLGLDAFVTTYPLLSWILSQTICIIYISGFVARKRSEGIFLAFATLILTMAFQFLSAVVMILVLPNDLAVSGEYSGIIGNGLSLICAILILTFTKIRNLYNNIILARFMYKSILLYSYMILVVALLYFKYDLTALYEYTYVILFVILLLVLSNTAILYYDHEISRKNHELSAYQKNLPIYESLIKDIRTSQHEFSNRLQNLEHLPDTCSTYEELRDALQRYTTTYRKPMRAYPLLTINMPLLAAALYNQTLRAEDAGIIISFDVVNHTLHSRISEAELTDYANILLQNAIEACREGDNIYVQITSSETTTCIEIRNPIDRKLTITEINRFFESGYSTKTSHKQDGITHGLGLYHLKKELEKKNGYIRANCIELQGKYWISFTIEI